MRNFASAFGHILHVAFGRQFGARDRCILLVNSNDVSNSRLPAASTEYSTSQIYRVTDHANASSPLHVAGWGTHIGGTLAIKCQVPSLFLHVLLSSSRFVFNTPLRRPIGLITCLQVRQGKAVIIPRFEYSQII